MTSISDTVKLIEKCTAVLLDVAGTTTSLSYITDTLSKYLIENCDDFLKNSWDSESVQEFIKLMEPSDSELATVSSHFKQLTKDNSDNKGVKSLQGLIYKKGYESGVLKSHVFEEVPKALDVWGQSRKIAIYSTGSRDAQQLLFANTSEGDLSQYIAKYFDQTSGSKTDAKSYVNIAKELAVEPEHIFFITDSIEEAEAAKLAGLVTFLVKRAGNPQFPAQTENNFNIISSFSDLIDNELLSSKRKIEEPNNMEPANKILKPEQVNSVNEEEAKPIEEEKQVNVADDAKAPETVADQVPVEEEKPAKAETSDSVEENNTTQTNAKTKETAQVKEAVNGDLSEKKEKQPVKNENEMQVDQVKEKDEADSSTKEENHNGKKNGIEEETVIVETETNGNSDKANAKEEGNNGLVESAEKQTEAEKTDADGTAKDIVVKKVENAAEASQVSVQV